jgi:hypothetical protein
MIDYVPGAFNNTMRDMPTHLPTQYGGTGAGYQPFNPLENPSDQASALALQEGQTLGRQAPPIGVVHNAGLNASRNEQLSALGAQQALMAGPSLAQMRAQQQFGQARQMMGAGGNALAARNSMLSGSNALGSLSQKTGNAVGEETLQSQRALGEGINKLGQGDITSQQQMEALAERQRQMYLTQRGQNLGQAQGYEQNYYNIQRAYEQQALDQLKAQQAWNQHNDQVTQQWVGAGIGAVGGGASMGLKA